MPDPIEEIMKHLVFLGYSFESAEGIGLLASHDNHIGLIIRPVSPFVMFSSILNLDDNLKDEDNQDRIGLLNSINNFNSESLITRCYTTDFIRLLFEAHYPLSYDRNLFGAFLDKFNDEMKNVFSPEIGLIDYLKR